MRRSYHHLLLGLAPPSERTKGSLEPGGAPTTFGVKELENLEPLDGRRGRLDRSGNLEFTRSPSDRGKTKRRKDRRKDMQTKRHALQSPSAPAEQAHSIATLIFEDINKTTATELLGLRIVLMNPQEISDGDRSSPIG